MQHSSDRVAAAASSEPAGFPSKPLEGYCPAPELRLLQEERPLSRLRLPDDDVGWLVTGHALARRLLRDDRFSVRPVRMVVDDGGFTEVIESFTNPGDFLRLDPPEHTRLRRQLTPYFSAARVAEEKPAIERIVRDRLDELEAAGSPADLMQFALDFASMALCDFLGVPVEERTRFERPTNILVSGDLTTREEKLAAIEAIYEYVGNVLTRKRQRPGDDLLSRLVTESELTEEELLGVAWFLFAAGFHNTAATIVADVFFLLTDPARWERLGTESTSVERTVEELLRYATIFPATLMSRSALEDIDIDGTVIKAGEIVFINVSAPNWDPEAFECPEIFNQDRDDARNHLEFGFGRHMCLGQHLARLEIQVCLRGLRERFPQLRLAVPPAEVPMREDTLGYGMIEALPIEW